jgi:hypothetical protein
VVLGNIIQFMGSVHLPLQEHACKVLALLSVSGRIRILSYVIHLLLKNKIADYSLILILILILNVV